MEAGTRRPMSYLFKQAVHYSKGHKARKAIFVHMAEGGGTVSWLQNPKNPSVSAHYVVEYTGRVVQMVSENDSAWGINPSLLRTTNDSAFSFLGESVVYGVTAAKKALGTYWYDPNASGLTIEVEGYAKDGPNAAQRIALAALIRDIRRRWDNLPALGHRDFQNYKACPGHKIAWVDFGGHGKAVAAPIPPAPPTDTEDNVDFIFKTPKVATVASGTWLYDNPGCNPSNGNVQVSPGRDMPVGGRLADGTLILGYVDTTPTETDLKVFYAKAGSVALKALVTDDGYTKATQDAAVATQKAADQKVIDVLTGQVSSDKVTIDSQAGTIATLKTDLAAAISERDAAKAAQAAAEATVAGAVAAKEAAETAAAAARQLAESIRTLLGL